MFYCSEGDVFEMNSYNIMREQNEMESEVAYLQARSRSCSSLLIYKIDASLAVIGAQTWFIVKLWIGRVVI